MYPAPRRRSRPRAVHAPVPIMPSAGLRIVTLVDSATRSLLETGIGTPSQMVHAGSVHEAVRAVREAPATVLFSPKVVRPQDRALVGRLSHRCSGIRTVAIAERSSVEDLLHLGACGVHAAVDLSRSIGWKTLRSILDESQDQVRSQVLGIVDSALTDVSEEARQFFTHLARVSPHRTTVRGVACELRLNVSTLLSRFFRAGLPSPKEYLSATRIVYARAHFEAPDATISEVAFRLQFSSPQSFGRHVRSMLGVTLREFRRDYSLQEITNRYVLKLFTEHHAVLRTFDPFGGRITAHTSNAQSQHLDQASR
jgi:AraC-like DNA-binding protein